MNRTARHLAPLTLLIALLVALVVSGCSAGNDDDGGSSPTSAEVPAADASADGGQDLAYADELNGSASDVGAESEAQEKPAKPASLEVFSRAVIRKGSVEMSTKDVGKAQIEVQKIVDRYAGEVTERQTESDRDDGELVYSRMVLRVPTDDFNRSVEALEEVGEHATSNTTEDDVTTKVIDVQTRLTAQRRSIARITVLFDQAESIRDIMAIEAELSRRQADLDALERKQAFLLGQSAMSTITVSIERIPEKKAAVAKADDHGFVAGLQAGWDALKGFGTGLATLVGALLPWLVVIALVGVPALLLARSLRRRQTPAVATATADADQSSP